MIGPGLPDRPSEHRASRAFALVTVLLALTALLALSAAAVAYGVGSQNLRAVTRTGTPALAAAEAGIDDFVFRLNENSNYFLYNAGNPPPDGNLAFSQYVQVPGGNTISTFRYTTDTSKIAVDGTILITSTGKVGDDEAQRAGDAAPPHLHRLPVLHGLRDPGPRALHGPAVHRGRHVHAGPGDHQLHTVRVRQHRGVAPGAPRSTSSPRTPSTVRCTPTTRSSSAGHPHVQRQHVDELEQVDATAVPDQLELQREQPGVRQPRRSAVPPRPRDAAEQLRDQGRDRGRQGRVPVHRTDEHHAQLGRHDDHHEPVLASRSTAAA